MKTKDIRLTKNVSPLHYTLHLHTDFKTHEFSGDESISLSIKKATKNIEIHSVGIDILSAVIKNKDGEQQAKISYNKEKETAIFQFGRSMAPGQATLKINFKGALSDSLRGFYKSYYDEGGKKKMLATTQFESTDARRAFPCFDEPEFKALFTVSLTVPKGMTAISNTLPKKSLYHTDYSDTYHFEPSPKMSTYLLAFIIGDFEHIAGHTKNGVLVRVFTTKGKLHQAGFALETAIKSIDYYEDYFNIKYPLPALDMIAIPDFESGAMENWGAVTYRETAILVDEEHSSFSNKQSVALTIAHELAHQWFGNLVTMSWWTDLWLNEGFASYMEYKAVDAIFPEWKIWEQFITADLGRALDLDSLENSHPVEVEVHHPSQIEEIFDAVSYSKGASIIRMLAEYIGEKNFKKGLQFYLKKHSYKNTVTTDLWDAFGKVSKIDVADFMKKWTGKQGYPLVSCRYISNGRLEIVQSVFSKNRKNKEETIYKTPLFCGKDNIVLRTRKVILPVAIGSQKINQGEYGFYRTQYSDEILKLLGEEILEQKLPTIDRVGLVRDIGALLESRHLSPASALSFIKNFKNETEYVVWVEIVSIFGTISHVFEGDTIHSSFSSFVCDLVKPLIDGIGKAPKQVDSHTTPLLRSLILSTLARYGHKETILYAKKEFTKKRIDPNLRRFVYNCIIRYGGEEEIRVIKNLHHKAHLHEEKSRLEISLTSVQSISKVKQIISFIEGDEVRPQDKPILFIYLFRNSKARIIAWQYIKKNWENMYNIYKGGHSIRYFLGATSSFTTKEELLDLKKFFKNREHGGGERTLKQAYEEIELAVAFKKFAKKDLESFLKSYAKKY